jgi:uncharacterized protein (DUF433 family)
MTDSVKYAFWQATSLWTQQWYRAHARRGSTMSQTPTVHIHLDEAGVPWIDDTNVKVIEVVLVKIAHGWSPEEMHFQHPDLSLSQIHAALLYYYDHQQAFDAAVRDQLRRVEALMSQAAESPILKRLRALGKLP